MAYDLLIRNGCVVDGSGGPSFTADVAVHQGKIVGVGRFNESATRIIDSDGRAVAPLGADKDGGSSRALNKADAVVRRTERGRVATENKRVAARRAARHRDLFGDVDILCRLMRQVGDFLRAGRDRHGAGAR